jgi:O-antigen/teichoic acid export membrane protein
VISSDRQIKKGAMLSYLGVFLGIISGLIYNPWMIHKIGDADYGLYTLAMSLINIFLIDFGLSVASQRYISKYRAENNQQAVDNIVGLIYKLYIIIAVVLAIIFTTLFFFIDDIYVKLTPAEFEKFKVLYIMVAIYSVTSFPFITLNGILSSYEKFIQLKMCDLLYKLLTIVMTAIALFIGYGVYVLVIVNLIASIIVTTLRIIFIKKCTPVKANFAYKDSAKVKEIFEFSIWTSVSIITSRLLLTLGPSILGIVSGSFEIAVFGYAVSIEGYIYSFVNAINGFFMPQLSRITADKDAMNNNERVLQLMISVGRFILMLFGLIFVGFLVLGRNFISMLVGNNYINAYYCVLLICGYGLLAYPQQIANTYAIVQNRVKDRAIISLISFGVYLLFVFFFGKLWGAVGIAISICLSLVTQTVLMDIMYAKKLHINIVKFIKKCQIKMLPGLLLFTMISSIISLIPIVGWLGFTVKAIIISFVYALFAWLFFLNKDEKEKLISIIVHK